MSVTLFQCQKCGDYLTFAEVNIVISATLDPLRGMLRVSDDASLPEGTKIPLKDIADSRCEECGSPTKLVILDECPHYWWESSYGHSPSRHCIYCNETQEGRLVFDD